jgi:hypothetical protein
MQRELFEAQAQAEAKAASLAALGAQAAALAQAKEALDARGFFSHASLHLHEMLGDTARVVWGGDGGAEGVIRSTSCCGGEEGGSTYLLLVGVMQRYRTQDSLLLAVQLSQEQHMVVCQTEQLDIPRQLALVNKPSTSQLQTHKVTHLPAA